MQFEETETQKEIRALARRFARKELLPIVDQDEREERFRPELIRKLGELGLTGLPLPEQYGGAGLGALEQTAVIEELGRASVSYAASVSVTGLVQTCISGFGTEEQQARYLPALASGQTIGSFSLSEAGSGSDAAALRCSARRDGDSYILNGTKLWVTQADVAGTFIVMARTGGPGAKGISAFIIEKGLPGFTLGKREKKMGWSASHTSELIFQNAKIPAAQVLGKEGEGFKVAMTSLDAGRINIAASAVGVAAAALDCALDHARQREQFGRPILEFQGVSFLLADMAVALDSARLLVQRAAWIKDQGRPFTLEAAIAKLAATDMAMKVTTDAVQVLGGSGYTQDFPVERYMRDAKVMQILEGTNQIQRIVIGKSLAQAGPLETSP